MLGAGAAGLAAIMAGHLDEFKGKKVVLLVCGGNIDTTTFGRCLERGLAAEGRLMKFTVTVSDRPGGADTKNSGEKFLFYCFFRRSHGALPTDFVLWRQYQGHHA